MNSEYLDNVKQQFKYYKELGERTFDQLDEEDLFRQYDDETNSIAIIVNHLWGNMMSRWTDFLNSDGEKEWRDRDLEFEPVIKNKEELMSRWNEGWLCVFNALKSITDENWDTTIYIRNQSHSILEAIQRQYGHYAYHIGQIVYIGKMIKGNSWNSLSIPKEKSADYNKSKFDKGKHGGHFSE